MQKQHTSLYAVFVWSFCFYIFSKITTYVCCICLEQKNVVLKTTFTKLVNQIARMRFLFFEDFFCKFKHKLWNKSTYETKVL